MDHQLKPEKYNPGDEVFYPSFLFKEILVMMLVFILVVDILAVALPVGLGDPADPTDQLFIPRPEWYFMSLYQLLKIFPKNLEVIATAVIPSLGMLVLFLIPFIDRNPEKRIRKRPIAMVLLILTVLTIVSLTLMGAYT